MSRSEAYKTPFGPAVLALAEHESGRVALLRDEAEPRAALYAAKLAGATRVIELLTTLAIDRLLRAGDRLVPDDLVDLTVGHLQTFFVGKGYGFLPQRPVFCPELRAALLAGLRAQPEQRSFARGVLGVGPASYLEGRASEQSGAGGRAAEPSTDDLAVRSDADELEGRASEQSGAGMVVAQPAVDDLERARSWGAHVLGMHGAPAAYLAKELELCYAVVCDDDWSGRPSSAAPAAQLLAAALPYLPTLRGCGCKEMMRATRERGLVGDDWRMWI